jgi:hypothetical protein
MHDKQNQSDDTRPGGISRRAVVGAAAWSVPVIALSTALPAAAASAPVLKLAFSGSSFSATCRTPFSPRVTVTTAAGAPVAGQVVTVTLPDGVTFSDGSTASKTFTTDAAGQAVITGLIPPLAVGTYSVVATLTDGASATTAVTTTAPNTVAKYFDASTGAGVVTVPSVPSGSTPVGAWGWLAPNGSLYFDNGGVNTIVKATGVTSANMYVGNGNTAPMFFTYISGGTAYVETTGLRTSYPQIPGTSKIVGPGSFLAPNGNLYCLGSIVQRNVASATSTYFYSWPGEPTIYEWLYYVLNNGTVGWVDSNGVNYTATPQLPAGTVLVAGSAGVWLTPAGDLWAISTPLGGTAITRIATGVASAAADYDTSINNRYKITYVTTSGTVKWLSYDSGSGNVVSTLGTYSVPAGTQAVSGGAYLTPDGKLYSQGSLLDTGVAQVTGQGTPSPYNYVQTWVNAIC